MLPLGPDVGFYKLTKVDGGGGGITKKRTYNSSTCLLPVGPTPSGESVVTGPKFP